MGTHPCSLRSSGTTIRVTIPRSDNKYTQASASHLPRSPKSCSGQLPVHPQPSRLCPPPCFCWKGCDEPLTHCGLVYVAEATKPARRLSTTAELRHLGSEQRLEAMGEIRQSRAEGRVRCHVLTDRSEDLGWSLARIVEWIYARKEDYPYPISIRPFLSVTGRNDNSFAPMIWVAVRIQRMRSKLHSSITTTRLSNVTDSPQDTRDFG